MYVDHLQSVHERLHHNHVNTAENNATALERPVPCMIVE